MDINFSELKAHLSRCLRKSSRDDAFAEIGPLSPTAASWRDRAQEQGRLRPGSQDWESLQITALEAPVDIQASLRAVREDPNEVRGR